MTVIDITAQSHTAEASTSVGGLDLALVQTFAMKVAGDHAVANNAALAYLGDRLGLWRALACVESTTSVELAEQTGLAERYLREWLAAQAAAGYLRYEASSEAVRPAGRACRGAGRRRQPGRPGR